jgi:hypothetical protein
VSYHYGMLTTLEAEVDEQGRIRPKETVELAPGTRLLITVLDDDHGDAMWLAEPALAADWARPEEDEAWSHLVPA